MTICSLNKKLYNSFSNINEAIIAYLKCNSIPKIYIRDYHNIDIYDMSQRLIFKEAKREFSKIGAKAFINNKEYILVTFEDIKESVAKSISSGYQKELLVYHINFFGHLDVIIENAVLIASACEAKNREKYKYWEYYIILVYINNLKFVVEFDTVIRSDGEKHFRLQRIYDYNLLFDNIDN